jgi:hypothetical protein
MKESSQTDQQFFESVDVANSVLLLRFQYFVSCFNGERTDKVNLYRLLTHMVS